jgi:antitoxin component of MazEF toxin-antitoxin module
MKVGKRGNGLWVRIPAAVVRELNLKVGEEAEIIAVREHSFEVRRVPPSETPESKTSR